MTEINNVEKSYIGKVIDFEKFCKLFKPNGLDGIGKLDYRFYMCEDEDLRALNNSYDIDDPRIYDFEDDEESENDEDEWKVSYTDYPYPDINMYAGLEKKDDAYIITSFSICKVYDTGNPRSFTHSSVLTNFEAEYIAKRLSCILK